MRKTIVAAALVLATGFLSSCIKDTNRIPELGESNLTLYVALPDQEEDINHNLTRSGDPEAGTEEESAIRSLTFFIFDGSGNREEYQSIEIDGSGNSTDPMWDSGKKALRITVTPGNKSIYCIANWTHNAADGMPDLSSVTSVSALTSTVRTSNSLPGLPPVMSGQKSVALDGTEQELTIDLVRQIARVQIFPMLSPTLAATSGLEIKLTGVAFYNVNNTSYLYQPTTLTNPAGSGTFNNSNFEGVVNPEVITATSRENAKLYGVNYYLPEHFPTSASDATYMSLRFDFNGTTSYYTIYLNDDTSSPHTKRYAIERNHSYAYYVTLNGIGDTTYPGAPVRSAREDDPITYEMITGRI